MRLAREGFTLVELVVVLTVAGVLAGMAVASLGGLAGARQELAAMRARTAMIFAQEWAMGSNNATWVAFATGSDLVSVYVEDPLNPGKANRLTLTDPLTGGALTVQLGSNGGGIDAVDFATTSEVQFDASGTPHDADGTALSADGTVSMAGGITLRVTANTGLVTVD